MFPFGATCTLMTSPHFLPFGPFIPAGSVGQSGSSRSGLGSDGFSTGASRSCADIVTISTATTAPLNPVEPARREAGFRDGDGTVFSGDDPDGIERLSASGVQIEHLADNFPLTIDFYEIEEVGEPVPCPVVGVQAHAGDGADHVDAGEAALD